MRCKRCGVKMEESEKRSILKGHKTFYRCSYCHEEVRIRDKRTFTLPFIHNREEEMRSRRAGPIELY
ncbi:MAG: hypothetical protein R6V01_10345 [Thermoplasmatota archaeon]